MCDVVALISGILNDLWLQSQRLILFQLWWGGGGDNKDWIIDIWLAFVILCGCMMRWFFMEDFKT